MAAVIKDIGEIWTRLYDHRPFLSGEIKYFYSQFEENRSDKEVKYLFDILEKVSEIKDTQINKLQLACDVHLPALNTNLDVAVTMCNRLLEGRKKYEESPVLISERQIRSNEWKNFIENMTEKCSKVEVVFSEKEEEFKNFYSDLEKKLNIR